MSCLILACLDTRKYLHAGPLLHRDRMPRVKPLALQVGGNSLGCDAELALIPVGRFGPRLTERFF